MIGDPSWTEEIVLKVHWLNIFHTERQHLLEHEMNHYRLILRAGVWLRNAAHWMYKVLGSPLATKSKH